MSRIPAAQIGMHGSARDDFQVTPYSTNDLLFHVTGGILNLMTQLAATWWLASYWLTIRVSVLGLAVSFLVAMFTADFVSGLLHWAFDTWWSETTPILGRMVIMVREHHVYPGRIFKFGVFHDAGTLSWITLCLTLPVYGYVFRVKAPTAAQGYLVFVAIVSTLFIVFMLEFHKAGHTPCAPKWVKILQKSGLVLSTRHHLPHHHGLHDRNYCLINGHVDRTLGALGMWRCFEWLVTQTTGAIPARDDHRWMRRYGRILER